ncbi:MULTISPECIES: response regulator [Dyadobacter]|jgi:CheY-like chemotaxis protein|uniref:Response regulator n=1 Tax=Dyadobacter chenhuakuii TaxID=2909339 RepID=A0A9X1U144_9BACT|nr:MULTISPECIES: response regulator [Dyadobacter]MCF2492896.1 response regulator [Dyadobacter chenhuakuii]MCF2498956.1 response regulator [Dyadobacter chenhuakuii]MCF2517728.1 response regulator [Dyadobacter sp. CY351]USJ32814.1 response regulator [Dyadobacter chenhuakuii]
MNKGGDIIIIEDDPDDQLLIEQAFQELGYANKRIYFPDGLEALAYLNSETPLPFIILSDINLPRLDGIQLRRRLRENASLNLKCIPYLFFTTALNQDVVIEAYSTSAQGFFVKPSDFNEIKQTLKSIVEYWKRCAAPNNFKS